MADTIRHKCFISYHKADSAEVDAFISRFDGEQNVFIYRAVREMDQNIIDSGDDAYVMRRIRELYLTDSTVTIVMVGKCTWARKYVDWEIMSSLRDDPSNRRSGLMGIILPSAASSRMILPPRLEDNVRTGYARLYSMPTSAVSLASYIEDAYQARTGRAHLVNNRRARFRRNLECS